MPGCTNPLTIAVVSMINVGSRAPFKGAQMEEVKTETDLQVTLDEVVKELHRLINDFPSWPTDPVHALGLVSEDLGQLHAETSRWIADTESPIGDDIKADVRDQAIRMVAMTLRFLVSMVDYSPVDHGSVKQAINDCDK